MNLKEFSGIRFRNSLSATRSVMSYHNKHKDGSGNFGFVIVFNRGGLKDVGCGMTAPNEHWYQISGNYRPDKTLYGLDFGDYSRPINHIPNEWTFSELIAYMKRFIAQNEPELNEPVKIDIT